MNVPLERFLTEIETCLGGGCRVGSLASEEAARTADAVLGALSLELSPQALARLRSELPAPLTAELDHPAELGAKGPPADLVGRVALELGLDREIVVRRVCCVLEVLQRHLSPGVAAELPVPGPELR